MARGSVFKKPSGNYAYRADIGQDPATGQRRQLQESGFRTKREAEAALDVVLGAVRVGTVVNQTATTLGDFLDEWLPGQKQRLKETTWRSCAVAVERIRNGLGKRKLQVLAPLEIERFYSALAESGGRLRLRGRRPPLSGLRAVGHHRHAPGRDAGPAVV
jgi:Phage integrase, N-terminal SAM-like domain/Arm DNA-binding domain